MKKLLAASVLLNLALSAGLGLSWKSLTAQAAAGGSAPAGNGDVNADGTIDISDVVYLLSNLFLGGPAPRPIECPPPAGNGLPATGQAKCYDDVAGQGWVEVPCEQARCNGQDGSHASGCPSAGRFVDNGDGTVTDSCTGLMWQKNTADVDGNGTVTEGTDTTSWCNAIAYCEDLVFAGHDDWRLPNLRELQSLVDYGRFSPSIDPVFGAFSSAYWSSTSDAEIPADAWFVHFSVGIVDNVFDKADGRLHVRAVRNAP